MGKRKRIKRQDESKKLIKEKSIEEEGKESIVVNFSYPFSLYSCKIRGKYTNYLMDYEKCVETNRLLFGEVLHYFSQRSFKKLRNENSHSHPINDSKQLELIQKILKELLKNQKGNTKNINDFVTNIVADADIWQLGYPQGLRLIGEKKGNILNLLFIDHHHLIYPSKNHNDKDFYKYDFCSMLSEINIAHKEVASTKE